MLDPCDCPGLVALGAVARHAAARAAVGTVRWQSDPSGCDALTATARIHTDGRGCLLVLLDDRSALAAATEGHPVLTVLVAADEPWSALSLEGVAHRVPVVRGATFRLVPTVLLLLGARQQPVPSAAYYAAQPGRGSGRAPAATRGSGAPVHDPGHSCPARVSRHGLRG